MNEKIRADELSKYYLCAVHGHMEKRADTLTGYLKKDSDNNIVDIIREARPGYKKIITKYRVVAERNGLSLLEVELGHRTHSSDPRAPFVDRTSRCSATESTAVNRDDKKPRLQVSGVIRVPARIQVHERRRSPQLSERQTLRGRPE